MPDTAQPFGPEWEVMELLCRGPAEPTRAARLAELVRGGPDWGELIDHALRHRMLTLLAHTVVAAGLAGEVPLRIGEHLRGVLAANLYRRRVWYAELARVLQALRDSGYPVAARKGAAYESTLYGGDGSRWLGDLDLLVRPADREAVAALMPGLGYQVGLYDFDTGLVTPFERAELIRYRLNPDHLPTLSLVTGDPLVPILEVDFATSLTWTRGPYQVPTEEVLESVATQPAPGLGGVSVPVPAPLYLVLDTTLHLFREAWFDWWLEKEQDVDLMKFGDVIRLWERYGAELAGGALRDAVERLAVVEPVCWVFEHLDRMFELGIVAACGLRGRVDEEFLFSAGGSGRSGGRRWHGSMRQRLYTKDRRGVFVADQPAAVP